RARDLLPLKSSGYLGFFRTLRQPAVLKIDHGGPKAATSCAQKPHQRFLRSMQNVISLVLGGGPATRFYPLTKYRSTPAVPLAGKYRLIDIPLSNCINSGLTRMYVLTQF